MKRIEMRSIVKSSVRTMKMIHSEITNSISVDVVLSENTVSQCKGKENKKGGHHFHDTREDKRYQVYISWTTDHTICGL
jgi:hypothetical protein